MMNKSNYPIDSPEMGRLIEYGFILASMETLKKRCLISVEEYSKSIKETNRLYKDVM